MTDRTLVSKRFQAIKANPKANGELLAAWPPGVPGVSKANDHQLDLIAAIMTVVESANGMDFEPWEPEYVDPVYDVIPAKPVERPDEGDTVDPDTLDGIKCVLGQLDAANLAFVEKVAGLAKDAGHYIGFVNFPYRRRVEIVKALIHLSSMELLDAGELIQTVTESPDHFTIGQMVGTMSSAQALILQMADTTMKGETE